MYFHTWIFAVFFLAFYLVFLVAKRTRFRDPWLLTCSYIFYGWWSPVFLLLITYSTVFDYFAVLRMAKSNRRGLWLALAVGNNLLLLSTFKYAGFIVMNINWALAHLGVPYAVTEPGLVLPAGISFYTFQSMSYTIDCYRRRIQAEPSFIRFATFVSLFPQLVAGPIQRASHLLPQLQHEQKIGRQDVTDGASLFLVGLFKKLALADFLAIYVDKVYAAPGRFGSAALILATVAYGWQIYFDFSGYTDMARGVARMMGYRLTLNFNHPYLATGLGDFWARWHISLSTWFKDYVYVPLGGNRHGKWATYRNMCLTMVISGVWHGAAWTFVIWGALHAVGRVITRELEMTAYYRNRVPRFVKQIWVYLFVTFTWIFFRARSLADARLIVARIFSPQVCCVMLAAGALILLIWAVTAARRSGRSLAIRFTAPAAVLAAGLLGAVLQAGRFSGALATVLRMFTPAWADPRLPLLAIAFMASIWAYQFLIESPARRVLQSAPIRIALATLLILYLAVFPGVNETAFIYFQF